MKRLRKLAKVVALVAVVLLIFVVVVIWRNSAKRNAAIASIREAADPISIAELRPIDVAPQNNAATFILPVSDDLQKLVNDIYPIAFADDYDAKSGLTEKQRQEARELFVAHTNVDEAMLQASQCQTLRWPLEYEAATERFLESLLNYTQTSRALARFHIAKSRMLTADGDADAAANACLQGLRMVRLQSDTPTIVSMMVNNACRITLSDELGGLIMSAEIQPKTHEAIEAELIKHDLLDAFVQTLKSERALGISSFNSLPSVLGMGWTTGELSNYVAYMNEQVELGSAWPYQQTNATRVKTSGMTDLLVPAVNNSLESYLRSIAQVRCLRVMNAIQTNPPEPPLLTINELGLPEEAITDPFSGLPLILKKRNDDWIVYSIGPNKTDDGGQTTSDKEPSLDVGI